MTANESRWVLWDFKWLFVLGVAVALLMAGVGITQQGLVSGMVFSGGFVLFAVVFSLVWSWRVHVGETDPELRQPLVVVGGVGIIGNTVVMLATGDWTALLNAVLIALFVGVLAFNLRDNELWTAGGDQKNG